MVEGIEAINKSSDNNIRQVVEDIAIVTSKAQQIQSVKPVETSAETNSNGSSSRNPSTPEPQDTVSINPEANNLVDSGVEVARSQVVPNSDGLQFNVKLNDGPFGPVIAKGSFSASENRFDVFLAFSFEENSVEEDGEITTRTLSANFKLSAETGPEIFTQPSDIESSIVRETANEFIREVTRTAQGKLISPPGAVVIELDEMNALVSSNSSPVFRRVAIGLPLINKQITSALLDAQRNANGADPVQDSSLGAPAPKFENDEESIRNITGSVQLIDITPPRVRGLGEAPASISGQNPITGETA